MNNQIDSLETLLRRSIYYYEQEDQKRKQKFDQILQSNLLSSLDITKLKAQSKQIQNDLGSLKVDPSVYAKNYKRKIECPKSFQYISPDKKSSIGKTANLAKQLADLDLFNNTSNSQAYRQMNTAIANETRHGEEQKVLRNLSQLLDNLNGSTRVENKREKQQLNGKKLETPEKEILKEENHYLVQNSIEQQNDFRNEPYKEEVLLENEFLEDSQQEDEIVNQSVEEIGIREIEIIEFNIVTYELPLKQIDLNKFSIAIKYGTIMQKTSTSCALPCNQGYVVFINVIFSLRSASSRR